MLQVIIIIILVVVRRVEIDFLLRKREKDHKMMMHIHIYGVCVSNCLVDLSSLYILRSTLSTVVAHPYINRALISMKHLFLIF